MAVDHDNLLLAALQKVYAVIRFRDRHVDAHGLGSETASGISAAYSAVKVAKGRDPITASFIDAALTVQTHLLVHPDIANLLLETDNRSQAGNLVDSAQVPYCVITQEHTMDGII
jgi:hypothetical protein